MTECTCMICLEDGADTAAPCGLAGSEPRFHARCLHAAELSQAPSYRCPHCNLPQHTDSDEFLSSVAGTLARWTLDSWLSNTVDHWSDKSMYLRVKEGFMLGEEGQCVEDSVLHEAKEAMRAATGAEPEYGRQCSLQVLTCRVDGRETRVCLRRVAIVTGQGAVLVDGFMLSAHCSRCSPRLTSNIHSVLQRLS